MSVAITVKLFALQCKTDGILLLVSQAVAQTLLLLVKVKTLGSTN